jgi:alpha-N-arabinofuranosidase
LKTWAFAAVLTAGSTLAAEPAAFRWFEYTSLDATRTQELPAGFYRNPVLPGYYPDPAVVGVGDRFYLVNSTFAHWPGIAIHESTNLVDWKLIGHALTDASKISFDGLSISRGVFAPSIHHHQGTWYIINTLVDAGGNFFVTAKDPAGPWSDPVWLKDIDGIDPAFFFDDDGKVYILNNGAPEGEPLYDGHRAIWMQEYDLDARKLVGPRKVVINGGVDLAKKPIWIEGPHIYKVNGWYYLMCAEGGTGPGHSEVIFRARAPWGPYLPYEGNPILTQRDLPADRADPVTNAGHADLVQKADGSWWAVFLASRPYSGDRYNTGRETFLLPVTWKKGWPVILPPGEPIPLIAPMRAGGGKRAAPSTTAHRAPVSQRDEFDGAQPGPEWLQVHVPRERWHETRGGKLLIRPLAVDLDAKRNPSFLARRQQDLAFRADSELEPAAAFQNEDYWYFLGTRREQDGLLLFLERSAGRDHTSTARKIPLPASIKLRIAGNGAQYSFYYDAGQGWQALLEDDDGSILSTEVAGGFVGTVLGPFARQE